MILRKQVGEGGVESRTIEDADAAHNAARLVDAVREVGWVGDDKLALGSLALRAHSDDLPFGIVDDLIDGLTKHVCPTVNGREAAGEYTGCRTGNAEPTSRPCKALGQFAQAVLRVDERRVAVGSQAFTVETDAVQCLLGRTLQIRIIIIQCHGVADELARFWVQPKLTVHSGHRVSVDVEPVVGAGILLLIIQQEKEKLAKLVLLKNTHQRCFEGFTFRSWHL